MRLELKEPSKSALVLALQWNTTLVTFDEILTSVQDCYGEVGLASEPYDFSHSQYYVKEMGKDLKKIFVEIQGVFPRDALTEFKIKAYVLEDQFMSNTGCRRLNVDPMIVTLENIVIATGKGYSHRIYLGRGVYGDLAFIRKAKAFESLSWTYPDYIKHLDFFESVRSQLQQNLKAEPMG